MMRKLFLIVVLLISSCDYSYDLRYFLTKTTDSRVIGSAQLASLNVSNTLPSDWDSPFNPSTYVYRINVPSSISSVDVDAQCAETDAQIVSGTGLISGLVTGDNVLEVLVKSSKNTIQAYHVTVHVRSTNANLASLTLSGIPFSFSGSTQNYPSIVVPNSVASTQVLATLEDSLSTITVNGTSVANGVSSTSIDLAVSSNQVTVIVTPEEGTPKQYDFTITRLPLASNNADLGSLSLTGMVLNTIFVPNTVSYSVEIPNDVTSTIITAIPAENTPAKVAWSVNGSTYNDFAGDTASVNISGTTTLILRGTAPDTFTTKDYTITLIKYPPFSINPSDVVSYPSGSSQTIAITGGTTNYTISKLSGPTVTNLSISGTNILFQAGSTSGNGVALVKDGAGKAAYLYYHVTPLYQLYPAEIDVKSGSSVTFSPSGGTPGNYTMSIQSGNGSINSGPATSFNYTGGSTDSTILAKDSLGNFYYIFARRASEDYGITPSKLKAGQTTILTPSGGTGTNYGIKLGNEVPGLYLRYNSTNYGYNIQFSIPTGASFEVIVPTGMTGSFYINIDDTGTGSSKGDWNRRIDIVP